MTLTDAELIEICSDFRDGILGLDRAGDGMCAAVSWPLAGYLRSALGFECECVQSDHSEMTTDFIDHVWIRLPDGRALDATFDQFCSEDKVKVYLGPPTEFHASPEIV